jgi:hypothetical protein
MVCGLIKDLGVILATFPYISLMMDVIGIDIPDAWGILLSIEWEETLGGSF